MKKKKIYHIHTDFKFLYDSYRFENDVFDNQLIFIGKKNESNQAYHNSALFFDNNVANVAAVAQLIKNANLVVLYDLCDFKKNLIEHLPLKLNLAWRFFGHELYSTRRDLMLSQKTIEIIEKRGSFSSARFYKIIFYLKNMRRRLIARKDNKYLKRINYILLFSEEEYSYLKKYWELPYFIRLNLDEYLELSRVSSDGGNNIIIGNSRNIYNNHLDIIDMIPKRYKGAKFIFFLNYGANGYYALYLEQYLSKVYNSMVYKDFLSKEEFANIYNNAAAFVLNSHRQMALGNLFLAIKYGLKIYLNDKNPLKEWLLQIGIVASSVESFKVDLENNNFRLTTEQKINNVNKFNELFLSYTREDFCNKINSLI